METVSFDCNSQFLDVQLDAQLDTRTRSALERKYENRPENLGELIVASSLYAAAGHVRRRSPRQRAFALWVDVLDQLPDEEDLEKLLAAFGRYEDEPMKIVRVLVYSEEARIGPEDLSLSLVDWLRETYARFVLRFPTKEEENVALREVKRSPNGWRSVILELALRDEYRSY